MSSVNYKNIKDAKQCISSYIHETAVLQSSTINKLVNRHVFFKCEHLQRTGTFKIRGALNYLLEKQKVRHIKGVTTYSSGNHAQAVALAAKILNLPAKIVVPKRTSQHKVDAIYGYGADIVFSENDAKSLFETCLKVVEEDGYELVQSSDDYDAICGQATLGLEFITQVPQLDAVIVSISEGGMCAGCAVVMKSIKPSVKMYCVEPEGKELQKSILRRKQNPPESDKFLNTMAEGLLSNLTVEHAFPLLCDHVDKVLTVNNADMVTGMKTIMTYLKQVVEPAAGATLGALIKYNNTIPAELTNIGLVLCGGNLDIEPLFNWFES